MSEAALFETIRTTRAMRRLKPDPVDDDLVRQILEAAICAPSGGNAQPWAFLVVKDPEVKRQVQRYYAQAFQERVKPMYAAAPPPPGMDEARHERQATAVEHLTEHFHEAPIWIVACLDTGQRPPGAGAGASIYPAVQNILLAARALGLGATLTTRHMVHGEEVDAIFGLPSTVHSFAIVPIGHPAGRFGPVRRGPLADVVHGDRWGQPSGLAAADDRSGDEV